MFFRFNIALALVMLSILPSQGQEPIDLTQFSEPITSTFLDTRKRGDDSNYICRSYGYLNGDRWLDFVTLVQLASRTNLYYVSYGNENGSFSDLKKYEQSFPFSYNIQLEDVNGDGLDDIISFSPEDVFEVYLNLGDESFRVIGFSNEGENNVAPYGMMFIKDRESGYGKIYSIGPLASGEQAQTKVRRYLFDALGGFTFREWVLDVNHVNLYSFHLNLDDEIDFMNKDSVYLSNGVGSYVKSTNSHETFMNNGLVSVRDLNGDGAVDSFNLRQSEITIRLNDGFGNLGPEQSWPLSFYETIYYVLSDVNEDDKVDLFLHTADGNVILTGNGEGKWSQPVAIGVEEPFYAPCDYNRDGLTDLISSPQYDFSTSTFEVSLRLNLGEPNAQTLPDIAYFTAEPDVIAPGGSTTLSWSVQNADQVTIEPIGGEAVHEGSIDILVPETTTYTLTASNSDGNVSTSVTVTVEDLAPVIDTFTLAPSSISPGGETTLSWQVRNADEVTIFPDIGVVDATGERVIAPSSTQRYVLTATRDDQVQTRSVLLSVLSAPEFIDSDNYWIQSDGSLVCVYPDPTSDGTVGNYSYVIHFYQNCNVVYGPVVISDELWPIALTLDPEDVPIGAYTIGVRRVNNDDTEAESPETITAGPEAANAANGVENYQRWLLHIPRAGGGFKSQLKMHNTNRLRQTTVTMRGFDRQGSLLSTDEVTLAAAETRYFPLADGESDSLFADVAQNLAYIGISEPGALTQIHQQYESESSGFSTWVEATDFQAGTDTGNAFELEAQKTEDAQDGVAILNLRGNESADVWVVQRNQNDELISEINLGGVAPGEKALWVISDLFEFVGNAKYTIESRSGATIQVIGLSFSSSDFYTPIPVLKLN